MKHFKIFTLLLLLTYCLPVAPNYHLTQKEAEERFEAISNIHYQLKIRLRNDDSFYGQERIEFELRKFNPIRVDFFQGKISKLYLNQIDIKDTIKYQKDFFHLPTSVLSKGPNVLEIEFETQYSNTGNGLHKFVDPNDNQIYIYSQFEAYHANKMFPCFDQPDLKAKFSLEVEAPKEWSIISTGATTRTTPIDNITNKHEFTETLPISTYVFSLHAGPYQVWNDSYESIPLRLFVRRSLANYVNPKEWFQFTKDGFQFFNSYFGIPYPFQKYDQLIVPEFNFGAMENVAAVTFSERFVSRGNPTRAQRENLSDVILHEMAHMWFGNLVTMKWWNGLWLNESFATYMASLAQEKNSEFTETWITFFEKMKQWAYEEDSHSTNHPVETFVGDTEAAFTQFDGITYGKGASVLKQLVFLIGEETFQRGVQNYLRKYSYKNATLSGFLEELQFASAIPMKKWSKDWLETKGTNHVEWQSLCSDKNLLWKVIQSAPGEGNVLRQHKAMLGLYKIETNSVKFVSLPIIYSGRSTTAASPVPFCPDLVVFNTEDHDFALPVWKHIPIEKLSFVLRHDPDPFRKLVLWTDLYRQVLSAKWKFDEFFQLASEVYPTETDIKIKRWILSKLASDGGFSYFTSRFWFAAQTREDGLSVLAKFLESNLKTAKPGSDEQRYLFIAYIDSCYSSNSQMFLYNILDNVTKIPGLNLDQDLRWSILVKLSSLESNRTKIEEYLKKEKKKDSSSRGVNSSYAAMAAEPNMQIKRDWINKLLHPKESGLSSSALRTVAYALFPEHQKHLQIQFFETYLQTLESFSLDDDENYLDGIAKALSPDFCSDETLVILRKFVNNHPKLRSSLKKTLWKQIDSEKKCIQMRNYHLTLN